MVGLAIFLASAGAFAAAAPGLDATPAARSPMLARSLDGPMAGVEEIVFAVRGVGTDGHWYANFGHHVSGADKMMYGPPGGRLCRLNLRTGRVTVLLDDPAGGVRDPQVHYDGAKILFSYRRGDSRYYHLYEINTDGTGLRQLTDGPFDDLEPTYLPDGDLVFCSSRCNRFVQCWYTQVATLYRSDKDGRNLRPISANIEQDNTPWMLPDGRLIYMRWEYVDRSRVRFHHLWTINPDGTGQMTYFGNMYGSTLMIDAKPIPGSESVVAAFCPNHGRKEHAGFVTVVSPDAGPDAKPSARRISEEPEWRDPWPFSEDCFLVARNRSLHVMDGRGQAEAFYTLPDDLVTLDIHEPRPLVPRPRERILPSRTDPSASTGKLFLADVTHGRSMEGVSRGDVKSLLVLETLPKPVNFSGTMEPISLGGTFTLPRILGTVPVEPDGSAYLEVPALRPLFFVALDKNGLSVKRMQSFVSVMPGETTGCVGCHENRTDTARVRPALKAMHRPPSRIEPIADVPQVFDFPRDIQPILDRHCTRCHNSEQFDGRADLTGDRGPIYSHGYATLMSRGQVAHGRDADANVPPRRIGSSASALMKRINGGHHDVRVTPHEATLVRLWIESGAPYAGTYAALGTGMVNPMGPDDETLARRCSSCHASKTDKKDKPLSSFRTEWDLLFNLSRPERSLILRAPLAKEAGGLGMCAVGGKVGKVGPVNVAAQEAAARQGGVMPFADTNDADYKRLLTRITKAKAELERKGRFDMPGFRPNEHYVREMKRYGHLPPDAGPDTPIDVYALDEKYWRSFWLAPANAD